jgi:hypothetical protein
MTAGDRTASDRSDFHWNRQLIDFRDAMMLPSRNACPQPAYRWYTEGRLAAAERVGQGPPHQVIMSDQTSRAADGELKMAKDKDCEKAVVGRWRIGS